MLNISHIAAAAAAAAHVPVVSPLRRVKPDSIALPFYVGRISRLRTRSWGEAAGALLQRCECPVPELLLVFGKSAGSTALFEDDSFGAYLLHQ